MMKPMKNTKGPKTHSLDKKNDERRWEAILQRDATEDGRFYFGVRTTRVYCRPSCPSRHPRRENVRYFGSPAEAERAGFRACLRCTPSVEHDGDPVTRRIREICAEIESQRDGSLNLADLAKRARLSPFHFQRRFKAIVGVSPKQYANAVRLRNLRTHLRSAKDVTTAVYDAGFGSSSRVYEQADMRLGMTPRQYRSGGRGVPISYATLQSPLGLMMVGATDRGLCFVQFGADESSLLGALKREYPESQIAPMRDPHSPEFEKWVASLNRHLAGTQQNIDLPLDVRHTAFQMRVWNYLQSIPYGEVRSYGEVAEGIAEPGAARAVARACATNVVAIVIPCHRVIRASGELGGYRWGLDRKRTLIDMERSASKS
jgi:AraC family transcriptional regulator, regulatory protein of adaptative response / methylated-DNA-[protein]-cysteine methyltransferase